MAGVFLGTNKAGIEPALEWSFALNFKLLCGLGFANRG